MNESSSALSVIRTGMLFFVGFLIAILLVGLVVVLCPLLLVLALVVIGPALSAFSNILSAIQ